jgi:hypothetical protein
MGSGLGRGFGFVFLRQLDQDFQPVRCGRVRFGKEDAIDLLEGKLILCFGMNGFKKSN